MGADRCLGDIVSEMLSTIEDSDEPYEEAHLYLVTLFPQFAHIFSEMKQASCWAVGRLGICFGAKRVALRFLYTVYGLFTRPLTAWVGENGLIAWLESV